MTSASPANSTAENFNTLTASVIIISLVSQVPIKSTQAHARVKPFRDFI